MNERLKHLVDQAEDWADNQNFYESEYKDYLMAKFAESIVEECVENFAKVWYEQGLDIRGAEIGKFMKRFNEHFGVK